MQDAQRSPTPSPLTVGLLGPLAVAVDDRPLALTSSKQAAILAVLAVESGRSVSPERLIEIVWDTEPDARLEHALQQHVSTLRKLVEPGRAARQESTVVPTRLGGYELVATVDVAEFDRLAAAGTAAAAAARWTEALGALDRALAMWRGPALSDVRLSTWFDAVAARLDEQRLAVCETRGDVLLAQGRHAELVPELERLLDQHPFRERLWGQLMVALYRGGRQADALAAFARARTNLVEELGLEPGTALRTLEQQILDQDPALLPPPPEARVRPGPGDGFRETFRTGTPGAVGTVRLPDGQVVHLLDGINTVGRLPGSAIPLADSRVSREHAEFRVADGRVVLHDLGSTNGTTVDGEAVTSQELLGGETVGIGGVELVYTRTD